jgi:cyclopropane-fatty-acyl-phospholipid synthase
VVVVVMFKGLDLLLSQLVQNGTLRVTDAHGKTKVYGDGTGSPVAVRLANRRLEFGLAFDPQLSLGEAFTDGRLMLDQGTIYDLLALLLSNGERHPLPRWSMRFDGLRYLMRGIAQFNPARRARRNVAHHYDIRGDIYDMFLDADRQYSCAYFRPGADLDEAQHAKKRHLAAKLALEPGHRVLDIGSGWGGLALYLARTANVDVTGITLSTEQLKGAERRAAEAGLAANVHFELRDYRTIEGPFDRIVSVGMFEHVGIVQYDAYFRKLRALLAPDGVALIHTIGRADEPTVTNPFIARHIFPGGYIPALSEMLAPIERSGLIVSDVEILRLHYAETLRAWRERFLRHRAEAQHLMGERFCRMWEFYLAGSETAFRHQKLVVFQIQLARQIDTLPLTRDYMYRQERQLGWRERHRQPPRAPDKVLH